MSTLQPLMIEGTVTTAYLKFCKYPVTDPLNLTLLTRAQQPASSLLATLTLIQRT